MNYTLVASIEKEPSAPFVISENVYFAKRYCSKYKFWVTRFILGLSS